jgi:hypothetical protein
MILLHRITSFVIALLIAVGFWALIFFSENAFSAVIILTLVASFLYARLLKWDVKRFSFWVFFGTPLFFILSSLFFYLFLENDLAKFFLGVVVTLGAWLYAENLFSFYHLPSTYQPYALEYLSLVLYVLSAFFFTSALYAAQLFLLLPVWVPALAIFWTVLFATIGVFWVSKVAPETSALFATMGAILLTELYVVTAMLPTSFVANAAIFSIFLYSYLGLSRAHVLDKLTKPVLQRYLMVATCLLVAIFATARWV